MEEQQSSSRFPPAEIPARQPEICHLVGRMMHFPGCASLLVWGVVEVFELTFKNVQKEFVQLSLPALLGRLPVCSVQFSSLRDFPCLDLRLTLTLTFSGQHAYILTCPDDRNMMVPKIGHNIYFFRIYYQKKNIL